MSAVLYIMPREYRALTARPTLNDRFDLTRARYWAIRYRMRRHAERLNAPARVTEKATAHALDCYAFRDDSAHRAIQQGEQFMRTLLGI